jgi:hypothetical protein
LDSVVVRTEAAVHLEQRPDGFWVTQVDLIYRGEVPGMDEAVFTALA